MIRTLTRGEVRKLSKLLRAQGGRLPPCGWCTRLDPEVAKGFVTVRKYFPREVAHDAKGYFFVGWERL